MKTILFLVLLLFSLTSFARDTTFLWTSNSHDYPHYVVCDGEQLNPTGIYNSKFKTDLPIGFNATCHVEARSDTQSAGSDSIQVIVIPQVLYKVAENRSYPDRPAYTLINDQLENEGDRIPIGSPCDHEKVFKTTSSGSWMKVGEKPTGELYALCKQI